MFCSGAAARAVRAGVGQNHVVATGIGLIGCGAISGIYLENLAKFDGTEVVAVADLDELKARERASQYGVGRVCTPAEVLSDPEVEVVLNLTVPKAHAEVAMAAVRAGKHVYNEKPLTVGLEETFALLEAARFAGVLVGCAPDTVLGGGTQTCRDLVDGGELGETVGFNAFMQCPGHESWHPSPAFYYEVGGGPIFDMGPYYLSCLVQLLGGVKSVAGHTRKTFETRTVTSQPLAGTVVPVEVPTHLVTALEFECGAIGQFTSSFDTMAGTELPHIEVYGTKATLRVPDPNGFGGEILLRRVGRDGWEQVTTTRPYCENSRGIGVLDMVCAIREGREPRAGGEVAGHVCEVMHLAHRSAEEGRTLATTTRVSRPAPMPREGLVCR